MTDTILIHGYAIELQTWFRPKKDELAGFYAHAEELEAGKAKVFRWTISRDLSFLSAFNPLAYQQLYEEERQKAQDLVTLKDLKRMLDEEQPSNIICHSMGCFLLLEYLIRFEFPVSVKKIVFIQADCTELELKASTLLTLPIQFVQVFRFLDPSLWMSSLYHQQVRLGLHPVKSAKVKNIYKPSFKYFNPHTSVLVDKAFKNEL